MPILSYGEYGDFEEVGRLRPDRSPLLDLSDVVVHALASGQRRFEHGGKSTEVLKAMDDVLSFKVSDNGFDLLEKAITSVKAFGEFVKMVLSGKAVHKSSNILRDRQGVDIRGQRRRCCI